MKLLAMAVILAVAFSVSAQTGVLTSKLQEQCQAEDRYTEATRTNDRSHLGTTDGISAGFCAGYIESWLEGIHHYPASNDDGMVVGYLDFRQGLTNRQVEMFFMKYVSAHPESLSNPANVTLRVAMFDADLLAVRLKDGTWTPKPVLAK